jgi:hypothetical protein
VRPSWTIFSVIAVLGGILPQPGLACTRVSGPPVKVKTTFVVFVHDPSGKPLSQAKIGVYQFIQKPPHRELVASAVTNKDGKAEITGLHDNYSIGATLSGVSSEIVQVDVYDDGSGASEISLTWPGGPITQIRRVSGVLGEGNSRAPWVGARVALRSTNGEVGEEITDSRGRFEFGGVEPGFYALHVKDADAVPSSALVSQLEGDVAIEVRRDATNLELPLWGFVASSCGLSAYVDARSMILFGPW